MEGMHVTLVECGGNGKGNGKLDSSVFFKIAVCGFEESGFLPRQ